MTLVRGAPKKLSDWDNCHATYYSVSLRIRLLEQDKLLLEGILEKFPDAHYSSGQGDSRIFANIKDVANDWYITRYDKGVWQAMTLIYVNKNMTVYGDQYKYADDGYISKTSWGFDQIRANGYNEKIATLANDYIDTLLKDTKNKRKKALNEAMKSIKEQLTYLKMDSV